MHWLDQQFDDDGYLVAWSFPSVHYYWTIMCYVWRQPGGKAVRLQVLCLGILVCVQAAGVVLRNLVSYRQRMQSLSCGVSAASAGHCICDRSILPCEPQRSVDTSCNSVARSALPHALTMPSYSVCKQLVYVCFHDTVLCSLCCQARSEPGPASGGAACTVATCHPLLCAFPAMACTELALVAAAGIVRCLVAHGCLLYAATCWACFLQEFCCHRSCLCATLWGGICQ